MCQDRSVQTVAAASPVAVSTATRTDSTHNAVHAEACSTSYDSLHELTPDIFQRKGAFNSRGQLLLKNLTYTELEQWCLLEGTSSPLICGSPVHLVLQMQGSGAHLSEVLLPDFCACMNSLQRIQSDTMIWHLLVPARLFICQLSPNLQNLPCRRKASTRQAALALDVLSWQLDSGPQ